MAQQEGLLERSLRLVLGVRESHLLEGVGLLVHQVDHEGEAAFEVAVKDAAILLDGSADVLEEAPHALADVSLVVDEEAEAGEALVGTHCAEVV